MTTLILALILGSHLSLAETGSMEPTISKDEAEELHMENGNFGSSALQAYESRYGVLSLEQRTQFLEEQALYENRMTQDWFYSLEAIQPDLHLLSASNKKSRLEIVVNKSKQRMSVKLNGKPITGLTNIKISTGKKASMTPKGRFSLAGKEVVKRRINRTFSTKTKKVYLEDAVQVIGGIFLHKASVPAQKNTLGRPASHGCVRIDRNKSAQVFDLVKKYRSNATVVIH